MLTAGIQLEGVCRIHIVSLIGRDRNSPSREGYMFSYDVIRGVGRLWVRQARLAFECVSHMVAVPSVNRLGHFVSVSFRDLSVDARARCMLHHIACFQVDVPLASRALPVQ